MDDEYETDASERHGLKRSAEEDGFDGPSKRAKYDSASDDEAPVVAVGEVILSATQVKERNKHMPKGYKLVPVAFPRPVIQISDDGSEPRRSRAPKTPRSSDFVYPVTEGSPRPAAAAASPRLDAYSSASPVPGTAAKKRAPKIPAIPNTPLVTPAKAKGAKVGSAKKGGKTDAAETIRALRQRLTLLKQRLEQLTRAPAAAPAAAAAASGTSFEDDNDDSAAVGGELDEDLPLVSRTPAGRAAAQTTPRTDARGRVKRTPPVRTPASPSRATKGKKAPKSSTPAGVDPFKKLKEIVNNIMKKDKQKIFCVPVDYIKLNLPDYPKIITQPMDLGTVKTKLQDGAYGTVEAAVEDVRLVWANATKYNPPSHGVHILAANYRQQFEAAWQDVAAGSLTPLAVQSPAPLAPPSPSPSPMPYSSSSSSSSAAAAAAAARRAPKPTPDLNSVPLSEREKRTLREDISKRLPPDMLEPVVDIIRKSYPDKVSADGDVEIDFDEMDIPTLRALQRSARQLLLDLKKGRTPGSSLVGQPASPLYPPGGHPGGATPESRQTPASPLVRSSPAMPGAGAGEPRAARDSDSSDDDDDDDDDYNPTAGGRANPNATPMPALEAQAPEILSMEDESSAPPTTTTTAAATAATTGSSSTVANQAAWSDLGDDDETGEGEGDGQRQMAEAKGVAAATTTTTTTTEGQDKLWADFQQRDTMLKNREKERAAYEDRLRQEREKETDKLRQEAEALRQQRVQEEEERQRQVEEQDRARLRELEAQRQADALRLQNETSLDQGLDDDF